jgi:hypothetical protein
MGASLSPAANRVETPVFRAFQIESVLRPTAPSDPIDVFKTKHSLADIGEFKMPPHGITEWPDNALFGGIMRFQ